MATLYRKYRPQTFGEAVGQNHVKITLEHELQTSNFAHAYLFGGPRAVGKTTLARLFSKAVNCRERGEGEHEPCNKCSSCIEITEGKSLDIVEMDAASHTGVDNVRENIIAASRTSPSKLKYKVFIIDEVHMLSISAFNALLKILEEPPANVIFILCTTEVHKVPSTIISRCERFDFKRVNIKDVVKKLSYIVAQEEISIDKSILETIAAHSEGHVRDAESLLGQLVAISGKEITQKEADLVLPRSDAESVIELLDMLAKKDVARGIKTVNDLVDNGVDLKKFSGDMIEVSRKLLLNKIDPGLGEKIGVEWGEKLEERLTEINSRLNISRIVEFISVFSEARNQLKGAFIPQLPLEMAITRLCVQEDNETAPPSSEKTKKPSGEGTPHPDQEKDTVSHAPRQEFAPDEKKEEDAPLSNGVDRDTIVARWNEVLAKVKKHNHSLSFILKMCTPGEVKGEEVCLLFKYKFHKERINDHKIRELVESAFKEVIGSEVKVRAELNENLTLEESAQPAGGEAQENEAPAKGGATDEDSEGMMNDLLQTFGGRVVK